MGVLRNIGRGLAWLFVALGVGVSVLMIWAAVEAPYVWRDAWPSSAMSAFAWGLTAVASGLAGVVALAVVLLGLQPSRLRTSGLWPLLARQWGVLLILLGVMAIAVLTMTPPCEPSPIRSRPPPAEERTDLEPPHAEDVAPPTIEDAGCLGGAAIAVMGPTRFFAELAAWLGTMALGLKLLVLRRGWRPSALSAGLAGGAFLAGIWFGLMPHAMGAASVVALGACLASFVILTLADRVWPRPRPPWA